MNDELTRHIWTLPWCQRSTVPSCWFSTQISF